MYTPRLIPYFLQEDAMSANKSPLPFFQGIFFTLYSVVLVCHQQNPPTCLATKIICFAPHNFAVSHQSSVLSSVGFMRDISNVPVSSYSDPSQVATPKCTNMILSCSCHLYCTADGLASCFV